MFVDATVDDVQQLIDGIDPTFEVHIVEPGVDGVAFMASVVEGRSDIDAIHVISHGNQGRINLGTAVLDETSINGEYADALITIGNALSDNGDILIYGCNFADGEQGAAAIAALATATGADIASSTDATGHAGLGGNWDLEVQSGSIESDVVVSEAIQESWVNLLAPSTLDWAVEFGATTDILGTTANTTVNGTTVTVGVTQTGTFDSTPIAQILPTGSLNGVSGIVELYMNASADDSLRLHDDNADVFPAGLQSEFQPH